MKKKYLNFNSYKIIDIENWSRKEIYEFYSSLQNPFYSITARSDASKLLNVSKNKKISGSQAILYMMGKALNDVPEFNYRLKDNNIIKYDKTGLSMVIAKEDGLFNFSNIDYFDDPKEFLSNASVKIEEAKKRPKLFPDEELRDDVTYISCVPWVDFTSLTNPMDDYRKDTIPRIVWGKYTKEGDKTTIPVAVEVNHRFIDGRHVGLFYQKLQENFDNADKIFEDV